MADAAALTWRQYRLERRMFWRNPSAAFFNFFLPLLFLALFGAIFGGNQKNLDVIVPGIAGMAIMSTTFSALAMNITFLREQGVLKRMRGTPLPTGAYLGGIAANAVTNASIQIALVILAGRLFFNIGWPKDWPELVVFVVTGVVCLASLGVAWSHVIPNFDAAPAYVNIVFLPTIFISGVFYDVDNTPAFLRDIAQALPLTHIIDGLSGAMVTGRGLEDNLSALGGDPRLDGGRDRARDPRVQLGVAPGRVGRDGAPDGAFPRHSRRRWRRNKSLHAADPPESQRTSRRRITDRAADRVGRCRTRHAVGPAARHDVGPLPPRARLCPSPVDRARAVADGVRRPGGRRAQRRAERQRQPHAPGHGQPEGERPPRRPLPGAGERHEPGRDDRAGRREAHGRRSTRSRSTTPSRPSGRIRTSGRRRARWRRPAPRTCPRTSGSATSR